MHLKIPSPGRTDMPSRCNVHELPELPAWPAWPHGSLKGLFGRPPVSECLGECTDRTSFFAPVLLPVGSCFARMSLPFLSRPCSPAWVRFRMSREPVGNQLVLLDIPTPRHDPWDCHRTADQARGGARGVNGAAVLWQSHGVSGTDCMLGIPQITLRG